MTHPPWGRIATLVMPASTSSDSLSSTRTLINWLFSTSHTWIKRKSLYGFIAATRDDKLSICGPIERINVLLVALESSNNFITGNIPDANDAVFGTSGQQDAIMGEGDGANVEIRGFVDGRVVHYTMLEKETKCVYQC